MPKLRITVTVVSDGAGGLELSKSLEVAGSPEGISDSSGTIRGAVGGMALGLLDMALDDYQRTPQTQPPQPAAGGQTEPAAAEGASPPVPAAANKRRNRR